MGLISKPLTTKIYSILNEDATLSALVSGVFTFVCDTQDFPYIRIDDVSPEDFGAHDIDGFQGTVQINVFHQTRSRIEVHTIQERIYQLLHNIDLELVDFPTINFRCNLSRVDTEKDNVTLHGVQQFNYIFGGQK